MTNQVFDFGEALKFLKQGKIISRFCWDDKRLFHFGTKEYQTIKIGYENVVANWEPNPEDLLAEDWHLIE